MSIGRHIGASEMLALQDAGYPWFRQIVDFWKQRTKQDPIDMALAMMIADTQRRRWNRICTFAGILCLVMFVMAMAYNFTSHDSATPPDLTFGLSLGLPIAGVLTTLIIQMQVVWRYCPWGYMLYSPETQAIMHDLSAFFLWSKRDPESLASADIDQLREIIFPILVDFALKVVSLEHVERDERASDWGKRYDDARKAFGSVYRQMKGLNLAHEGHGKYYREAERVFAAAPRVNQS